MALRCESTLLLRKLGLRFITPRRHRVKEKWVSPERGVGLTRSTVNAFAKGKEEIQSILNDCEQHVTLINTAATRPKHPPSRLALQHLDAFCSPQLRQMWPSIRCALLSEAKHGALVNNFCQGSVLTDLEAQGCRDFISGMETGVQPTDPAGGDAGCQQLSGLQLSPHIRCFVYPRGNVSRFKPARPDQNGLLGYYLMDAASVLPCLALNVQEGHNVLDLCAAPGGKTVALLQTLSIGFLCVNDSSVSRTLRLRKVLRSYVPKQLLTDEKLRITTFDGTIWGEVEPNTFDRVLVDVPCTTDRHSVLEDDNNIFSKSRTGERRGLPQLQLQLLLSGIEAACRGGEIVYCTCTLSQQQNASVVEQAIHWARESHGIQLEVVDLRPLTHMFRNTFHFAPDLHLGEMVVPHLAANFGPIYMCKLRRLT